MNVTYYISNFFKYFSTQQLPWELTSNLKEIITNLPSDFNIIDGISIHNSVIIEKNVTIKRPFIAMENCILGANTYF